MKWIKWIDTMVAVAVVALVMMARGPSLVFATNCGNVPCGSGFNGSYHDFVNGPGASHSGTVNLNGTNTTVGQCTLCHTPHNAIQSALAWNHALSNNTQFTWSDADSTMAGTPYATIQATYAGPTAKCLSCHDGSVSPATIAWFEGQVPLPGPGTACTTTGGITTCAGTKYDTIGNYGNMKGMHPVAMPYPCAVGTTYNGVSTGAQIILSQFNNPPKQPIRLCTQDGAGTVIHASQTAACTSSTGIECGSCHDIHNSSDVQDMDLLRGTISGSSGYICNNCHNK